MHVLGRRPEIINARLNNILLYYIPDTSKQAVCMTTEATADFIVRRKGAYQSRPIAGHEKYSFLQIRIVIPPVG